MAWRGPMCDGAGVTGCQRTDQSHDTEPATLGGLHPVGGTDLGEEARLTFAVVAYDVKPAPGHVGTVAHLERSLGSTDPHGQRPGKDLDALVLASVDVAGDPASGVEPHLQLQQLSGVSRPVCKKVRC